jgi:hypothetical protein
MALLHRTGGAVRVLPGREARRRRNRRAAPEQRQRASRPRRGHRLRRCLDSAAHVGVRRSCAPPSWPLGGQFSRPVFRPTVGLCRPRPVRCRGTGGRTRVVAAPRARKPPRRRARSGLEVMNASLIRRRSLVSAAWLVSALHHSASSPNSALPYSSIQRAVVVIRRGSEAAAVPCVVARWSFSAAGWSAAYVPPRFGAASYCELTALDNPAMRCAGDGANTVACDRSVTA